MSPQAHSHAFSSGLQGKHKTGKAADSTSFLDLPKENGTDDPIEPGTPEEELVLVRAENAELRQRLEEAEHLLQAAATSEEAWLERQKEYELLLEEKSEVIRELHHRFQQAQETQQSATATPAEGTSFDAAELDELEQLKNELEEQRRQLDEDEKSLMAQMRQMEMSLSRDRAELARQRSDVQRLHAELTREIEVASRDPGLRERLAGLRRRQQDAAAGKSPASPSQSGAEAPVRPAEQPKKSSGLLRRIFGGD